MPEMNLADRVAEIIADRIETTAQAVAEAILVSPLLPDVVQPSQKERLDYFRAQFFLPDGSPNAAGRQAVLELHGAQTFEDVAVALSKEG
jgi:hypothetical protein